MRSPFRTAGSPDTAKQKSPAAQAARPFEATLRTAEGMPSASPPRQLSSQVLHRSYCIATEPLRATAEHSLRVACVTAPARSSRSRRNSTSSPAFTPRGPPGMKARPFAPTIDARCPSPGRPVELTCHTAPSRQARTRTTYTRPSGLLTSSDDDRPVQGPGGLAVAHETKQRRTDEQLERDHRRDRVAGEPEHQRAAAHPECQRLARLHGDAPQPPLDAEFVLHVLDEVELAHRHPARGDKHVVLQALLA